jgi:hypothetical protein
MNGETNDVTATNGSNGINGTDTPISEITDSESSETNDSVVPEYTSQFNNEAEYTTPQEFQPQQSSDCSLVDKVVPASEPSMGVSKRPAEDDADTDNHESKRLKEDGVVGLQVPTIQAGGD